MRDPLSPKPILDRPALEKALKANGVVLKNPGRHLDVFYQQLHRSGYPPLKELIAELRGRTTSTHGNNENSEAVTGASVTPRSSSISKRPGKRPQLPKALLDYLENTDDFEVCTSRIQLAQTSSNGSTTKLAVELQDGHVVESVLMRHEGRVTICVSSQVGCAMGCTFCATGTMGIKGSLSSGEILEQLVHGSTILAQGSDSSIRNVVFMGMGEPLNNYQNVLVACRSMIDRRTWNLAHNRVTVSTVGVVSRMRDLTRDLPQVNLALSLHAPTQEMREKIVPAARGTPIESLIEAVDAHMMALVNTQDNPQGNDPLDQEKERQYASKKRRAMIEYVMLTGPTSTLEAAHQLGKLCDGRELVVNLIPYNKTDVKDKLSCPSEEHMMKFRSIVSQYGSFCSIRRTMGSDIAGACGQLVVEQQKAKEKMKVADIEDGFENKRTSRKEVNVTIKRPAKKKSQNPDRRREKNNERLVRGLTTASAIAATCFIVSGAFLLLQRRRR